MESGPAHVLYAQLQAASNRVAPPRRSASLLLLRHQKVELAVAHGEWWRAVGDVDGN